MPCILLAMVYKGGCTCTRKPQKAELGSDSTGEGAVQDHCIPKGQRRRNWEAKSYMVLPWWIHQQGLQKRPGLWKACPQTCMQDGTEAKLGNYVSHVHSIKNSSN